VSTGVLASDVKAIDKEKCLHLRYDSGGGSILSQTDNDFLQPALHPRCFHMEFVVEKVALKYILLSCI
jgi:hypothetical protein